MAKENGEPTAAEKGKGKMVEKNASDGKKSDEVMKDRDDKPLMNGKKGDEPQEGSPPSSPLASCRSKLTVCRGAQ